MAEISLPTLFTGGIYYSREHYPTGTVTNPRRVMNYELEVYLEDSGESTVNGTAYPIHRNQVLFAQPGDIRQSRLHFKSVFLHFQLPAGELTARLSGCPRVMELPEAEALKQEMLELCEQKRQGQNADLLIAAGLLKCLHRILQATRQENHHEKPLVQTARDYIEHHFHQKIDLEDIAAACHLSPVYFHRQYTAAAGETPRETLLRRRLTAAHSLLRASELPMAEIALGCGFSSQAYFSQCFREQRGCTPLEYRRQCRLRLIHPDEEEK